MTDERCGFCQAKDANNGYCLPVDHDNGGVQSSAGPCMNKPTGPWHVYNETKYKWADVYCKTNYTWLPIVLMVVYLCAFSIGTSSVYA